VKTLDQIWNENFEFLPAGDLTGYSGSCGNGLGGDDGDNQKSPLDTLADKLASIYGDAAMSDARKQQLMDGLIDDFFNGNTGGGLGPFSEGPSPDGPVRFPGNTNPTSQPSTDPSDGPIPPAYGVPIFPDARDDVLLLLWQLNMQHAQRINQIQTVTLTLEILNLNLRLQQLLY